MINGEPRAKANGFVLLTGVRPGVDGTYYLERVEHLYSRQGYVTWLANRDGDLPMFSQDDKEASPLSSFIFLTLRDGKIRTAPLLKINSPQIQRVRFAFAFHRAAVPNRVVYGVMRGDPRATSGPAL